MPQFSRRAPPPALEITAKADDVAAGEALFASNCAICHGKNAVGRYGGSVPDLRYAGKEAHDTWHAIVVGGSGDTSPSPRRCVSDKGPRRATRFPACPGWIPPLTAGTVRELSETWEFRWRSSV